ncbi:hypothetical protein D3C81_317990 [compost metagenome]
MSAALLLPSDLSMQVVFQGQLLTLGRYLRVLELAAQRPALGGVISLPWSDWLSLLDCTDTALRDFFAAMQRARLLGFDADGVVTVLNFAELIPAPPAYFLFTDAQQVANWCAIELGAPPSVLSDPHTQQLFRRWVATHVTREELEAAAQAAVANSQSLSPAALHEQLQVIRKDRIEKARNP